MLQKSCNSVSGYTIDAAAVERKKLFDAAKTITGQKRNYEGNYGKDRRGQN